MVKETLKKQTRKHQQRAKIPGFRPGKTPLNLVRKRFNKEILSETMQELYLSALQAGIKEHELKPATTPSMDPKAQEQVYEQLKQEEAMRFPFTMDLIPEFPLPEYKNLKLSEATIEVTDEEIDERLNLICQQRQMPTKKDGPAEHGDVLEVAYTGTLEEEVELPDVARSLLHQEKTWVMLDEERQLFPGMASGLVGAKAEETVTLETTFPEDFAEPSISGKKAKYDFTIFSVQEMKAPELDDAFAQTLGQENIQQLRQTTRLELLRRKYSAQRNTWGKEILDILGKQLDFPLPPTLLKQEIETVKARLLREEEQKKPEEQAKNDDAETADKVEPEEAEAAESEEERNKRIAEEAEKKASQQLRMQYLLQSIADRESITVTNAELEAEIKRFQYSLRMDDYQFQERINRQALAASLSQNILANKVTDQLINWADVPDFDTIRGAETEATDEDQAKANAVAAAETATEEQVEEAVPATDE